MCKKPRILVFAPSILFLLYLKIRKKGTVYYTDVAADMFTRVLLRKFAKMLLLLNIRPFIYEVGIGGYGDGVRNNIYEKAMTLTEEFYERCSDKKLIKKFNSQFCTNSFGTDWKNKTGSKIYEILLVCYGAINNPPSPAIVYTPYNSYISFTVSKFIKDLPFRKLEIRYFYNIGKKCFVVSAYFALLIKKVLSSGISIKPIRRRQTFKVITEAIRPIDDSAFSLLEWWHKDQIRKEDILIYSISQKEMGRIESYNQAKKLGFSCTRIDKRRKIPINELKRIAQCYLLFPIDNLKLILKVSNIDFFILLLLSLVVWNIFFLYFKVKFLISSTLLVGNCLTTTCNMFGCSTVVYNLSYLGSFIAPHYAYLNANHLLIWGEAQIHHSKKYHSVDNIYFTGFHGASYFYYRKEDELLRKYPHLDRYKKNIVFFDNKLMKDGANPEPIYFRYLELIVNCSELLNVNIIFRPKVPNPFDENIFNDRNKVDWLRRQFEDLNISVMSREEVDVIAVISLADVVVYSTVGTPSMIALMFDIPGLSYYDFIDDTPDPIMKKYQDELVFDDQEKLIGKIEKIIDGYDSPRLMVEDKKWLNHYLDVNGLERLQSIIADLVCGNKPIQTNHDNKTFSKQGPARSYV